MTFVATGSGLSLRGRLAPTSVDLRGGELACLIGPNGSGKTSLLHALAGIGGPEGAVRIDGVDPRSVAPGARGALLAYLPASRDIVWPLSGRDLVALGLPIAGTEDRIERVLELLALKDVADRRVDRMSTGERSRLLIARVLAAAPRLLLLDEPTANLDPLWQLRLMDELRALANREGRALLVAIHDLDLASRYADRLLVMNGGRVVADGRPEAILSGPEIAAVFGIERGPTGWQPISSTADRQPSP